MINYLILSKIIEKSPEILENQAEVIQPRPGDLRAAAPIHERQHDGKNHRDQGKDNKADEVGREEGVSRQRIAPLQLAHLALFHAFCHVVHILSQAE